MSPNAMHATTIFADLLGLPDRFQTMPPERALQHIQFGAQQINFRPHVIFHGDTRDHREMPQHIGGPHLTDQKGLHPFAQQVSRNGQTHGPGPRLPPRGLHRQTRNLFFLMQGLQLRLSTRNTRKNGFPYSGPDARFRQHVIAPIFRILPVDGG
jgi:hypothetical protein